MSQKNASEPSGRDETIIPAAQVWSSMQYMRVVAIGVGGMAARILGSESSLP